MTSVDISEATHRTIKELAERSGLSLEEVAELAVYELHSDWIGQATPGQPLLPFKKRYSTHNADVVLLQKDQTDFYLDEGFRYVRPDDSEIVVHRGNVTDLASVPPFLTWLVPRYGKHSLPALLHDQLINPTTSTPDREAADQLFRDTMVSTGVPFVRRWLMWAAVSLGTLMKRPLLRVLVILWLLAYALLGVGLLLCAGQWWQPPWSGLLPVTIVAFGPLASSLLWGRHYRVGLITAYTLMVLPASVIAVVLTTFIYMVVEQVAKLYLRVRNALGYDEVINPIANR